MNRGLHPYARLTMNMIPQTTSTTTSTVPINPNPMAAIMTPPRLLPAGYPFLALGRSANLPLDLARPVLERALDFLR